MDVIEECLVEEEPELGACCVKDECLESTEDECNALAGDYQGDGSSCLDVDVSCDSEPVIGEHKPGKGSASCSTAGAAGGQGLGLLLVSLVGLVARRRQN